MSEKPAILCNKCKNKEIDYEDGLFYCSVEGRPADQPLLKGCNNFEEVEY